MLALNCWLEKPAVLLYSRHALYSIYIYIYSVLVYNDRDREILSLYRYKKEKVIRWMHKVILDEKENQMERRSFGNGNYVFFYLYI
jgi:hypothetical protein